MLTLVAIISFIAQTSFGSVESHNLLFLLFDYRSYENGSNLINWGSANAGNGCRNIKPHKPQLWNDRIRLEESCTSVL